MKVKYCLVRVWVSCLGEKTFSLFSGFCTIKGYFRFIYNSEFHLLCWSRDIIRSSNQVLLELK